MQVHWSRECPWQVRASARLALALILLFGVLGAAGLEGTARAQSLSAPAVATVDTVADENDGCGVGGCSLREAIAAVDAGGTVAFSLPVDATIVLSSTLGELAVAKDVTIDGTTAEGLTISGGDAVRVFSVAAGATVTLQGLTVSGGAADSGAGISNRGTLTLDHVTVSGNRADSGAGILNWGTLTAESGTICDNAATGYGGGVYNSGSLTLRESGVSGNSAAWGGGLVEAGSTSMDRVWVHGNTASDIGGGLLVAGSALAEACLFSGNVAPYGGAIYNAGTLRVTNTTLSGNQATADGGALHSYGASTLVNTTVTANEAGTGGGISAGTGTLAKVVRVLVAQAGGDGAAQAAPKVDLRNTFLAGNSASHGPDAAGSLHSLGYNLLGSTAGYEVGGDTTGNIVAGENLFLGPLADNGGPTATHALLRGSPAIDAGSCEDGAGNAVGSDQRGIARPQGAGCDIGAFEAGVPRLDLNGPAEGTDVAASFTEDGGAVVVAPDATVSDADSGRLASLQVTLVERPDGGDESLAVDTSGTGLSASYDGATGILTVSGDDTLANYQAVLRRITYNNASQNPDPAARTLRFVADDGNYPSNSPTATVSITPVNDPPAPAVGGPYSVAEGGSLTLHGSASDADSEDLTYQWDLNGDGIFEVDGPEATLSAVGRDGPDSQAVTLRACDDHDSCAEAGGMVEIANVAPDVALAAQATIGEGATFTAQGSFTDPAPDTWTATVDYGDGGGAVALALDGKAFSLSHGYPLQGVYSVTVAVTDDDGGTGQATCWVDVTNAAPKVSAPAAQSAKEAQPSGFALGSFSDRSGDGPWTVKVDWGDGSGGSSFQADAAGALANWRHTYDDSGRYTVTVRVTDKDGGTGSATFSVSVANRDPSVTINAETQQTPGWLVVDLTTSVSDPSKADRRAGFSYSWRLTRDATEVATGTSASFGFSIALDAPGTYTARVEVTDKDGGQDSASWYTVIREPLDARIQIVWPHGGVPVSQASLANISAWLLQRGTLNPPDLSSWAPEVLLWRAVNNEPAQVVARGTHRGADGREAALFDFTNIDVSAAQDPANRVYFFVTLDGTAWRSNVWAHAADGRTYHPAQDVPTGVGTVGTAVDARIEVLWPHDGAPVSQATTANLTAALFNPGTLESVPESFEPTVRLWRALNNGVAEEVATGTKRVVTANGLTYPVWDFNNVDVSAARDAQNKVYFYLTVDGIETHSSIWVHGSDARTFFPQWDLELN